MRSVFECVPQGMKFYHLRMPPIYVAYLRTYPKANRSCCLVKLITTHAPAGSKAALDEFREAMPEIPQAEPKPAWSLVSGRELANWA